MEPSDIQGARFFYVIRWVIRGSEVAPTKGATFKPSAQPPQWIYFLYYIYYNIWIQDDKFVTYFSYKREEIKIQAWENHQKAKTEAEMRKIEVMVIIFYYELLIILVVAFFVL